MRKNLATFSLVAVLASTTAVALGTSSVSAGFNVSICHRTNSATNPYRAISPNVSAVDGAGNGDHFVRHQGPLVTSLAQAQDFKDQKIEWGDIIPPVAGFHGGLNWPAGEAILLAGCRFPGPPPTSTEPSSTTAAPTTTEPPSSSTRPVTPTTQAPPTTRGPGPPTTKAPAPPTTRRTADDQRRTADDQGADAADVHDAAADPGAAGAAGPAEAGRALGVHRVECARDRPRRHAHVDRRHRVGVAEPAPCPCGGGSARTGTRRHARSACRRT